MNEIQMLAVVVGYFAIFIMSVVMHEVSHGYVALMNGDPTAARMGRLSLNPLVHIDPVMSIIFPLITLFTMGVMFGGAKPVPVNPHMLRNPVADSRKVSLAGVGTNFTIAAVLALLIHLVMRLGLTQVGTGFPIRIPVRGGLLEVPALHPVVIILGMGCVVNLFLGLFNLLPVPPLDGSQFLKTYLPAELRLMFDRIGFFGIIILIFLLQVPQVWEAVRLVLMFLFLKVFMLGAYDSQGYSFYEIVLVNFRSIMDKISPF